jgi:predicted alpha/beta hydrolase
MTHRRLDWTWKRRHTLELVAAGRIRGTVTRSWAPWKRKVTYAVDTKTGQKPLAAVQWLHSDVRAISYSRPLGRFRTTRFGRSILSRGR